MMFRNTEYRITFSSDFGCFDSYCAKDDSGWYQVSAGQPAPGDGRAIAQSPHGRAGQREAQGWSPSSTWRRAPRQRPEVHATHTRGPREAGRVCAHR
jgi:hypothetical protein